MADKSLIRIKDKGTWVLVEDPRDPESPLGKAVEKGGLSASVQQVNESFYINILKGLGPAAHVIVSAPHTEYEDHGRTYIETLDKLMSKLTLPTIAA